MKKALLLSAAALLLAVSCTRRPVRPAFGTVSVDTLLGDSGAGCRIEYRFATILNAAESPALQAVEQANIRYFFQTGAFRADSSPFFTSILSGMESSRNSNSLAACL